MGNNKNNQKLQGFINKSLKRILNIRWTERVTNEILWERSGPELIKTQILKRRRWWIGHTLRKLVNNITRQAFRVNPQGKSEERTPQEHLVWGCGGRDEMGDLKSLLRTEPDREEK